MLARHGNTKRLILRDRVIQEHAQDGHVERRFHGEQLRVRGSPRQRGVQIRSDERVLADGVDRKRAAVLQ